MVGCTLVNSSYNSHVLRDKLEFKVNNMFAEGLNALVIRCYAGLLALGANSLQKLGLT